MDSHLEFPSSHGEQKRVRSCSVVHNCGQIPKEMEDYSYLSTVDVFDGLLSKKEIDVISVLQRRHKIRS